MVTRALGAPDNLYNFTCSRDLKHNLPAVFPRVLTFFFCVLVKTVFSCNCQHAGWYAAASSLALANTAGCCAATASLALAIMRFVTLMHLRLRCRIFSCTCQRPACYAAASSLALAIMRDGTLPRLLLHLPTCGMVRCCIFSCTCQHAGCYAAASSLALANVRDVTLLHLLLHLPTCKMLRCRIFSCTCQHAGWYAAASSLALANMQACYAAASSLALGNMRDVTLVHLILVKVCSEFTRKMRGKKTRGESKVAGAQQIDKLCTWCKGFICGRVKTRTSGLPNPQLFNQAYQYVWRKNNVDKISSEKKQVLEIMTCRTPCKYHGKCVSEPVLLAFRGRFAHSDVNKTLRGLKNP